MSKLSAMLMNLQKEQFINLNINGSLTINNNIVSNFSSNDYIRLDYPFDLSKNIEIEFDFTTSNDVTTQQSLFWQDKGFGCFIQNNNLLFYVRDNNENISKTANITISANTNYKIRIVKIGTTVKWFIGSNSLIEQESFINRDFTNLTNYYMTVGTAIGSNTYFSGSVNFANSYTKVDNIKYKYQFTISLTKVGNPTIVDGVVSGFSSSNYLIINDFPKSVNFSGKVRAKLNADNSGFSSLLRFQRTSPNDRFSIEAQNTTNIRIYHYNETTSSNSSNTIYYLTLGGIWIDYVYKYDRVAKTINIKAINVNDNSIVFDVTYDNCVLDNTDYVQFGYMFNGWNGEIDLNETNIKINSTKYKIVAVPEE